MIELDDRQQIGMQKLRECPGDVFVFWWAMGKGKTRLALAAFMESEFEHCVVVTRRVAFGTWIDEIDICNVPITVFENNYQMCNCRRIDIKKGKTLLLVSASDLKNIPVKFPYGQMIVVDELYLFANPKSQRSLKLQKITLLCSSRIGLSGTIMPAKDNIAIYGQLKALFGHHPLGRTTTEFRSRFQEAAKGRFGRVFANKTGSDEEIAQLLSRFSDTYFPESRPTRTQIVKVDKTPEQVKAVKSLKEVYEFNNKTYDYALQIVHVINGISNGWWLDFGGNLVYHKSTKLEMLHALVDDIVASGSSVVVWCAYHNDITRIASEIKHDYLSFTGDSKFDAEKWKSGKVSVVLATEANGASVNHFKHVKFAIYFSIDYKLLNLQQSMSRHERTGSSHDGAHYYFIQTRGTIDADTYRMVTASKYAEQDIIKKLAMELPNL